MWWRSAIQGDRAEREHAQRNTPARTRSPGPATPDPTARGSRPGTRSGRSASPPTARRRADRVREQVHHRATANSTMLIAQARRLPRARPRAIAISQIPITTEAIRPTDRTDCVDEAELREREAQRCRRRQQREDRHDHAAPTRAAAATADDACRRPRRGATRRPSGDVAGAATATIGGRRRSLGAGHGRVVGVRRLPPAAASGTGSPRGSSRCPAINITSRSIPMPSPPVGGRPYSSAST